jgi:hypothetical protein
MWKLAVAFVVFAVIVVYVLSKSGGSVDMSGEKHGAEAVHAPADGASAAMPAASAASN